MRRYVVVKDGRFLTGRFNHSTGTMDWSFNARTWRAAYTFSETQAKERQQQFGGTVEEVTKDTP